MERPVIDTREWTVTADTYTDVIGKTTLHGTSRLVDVLHVIRPLTASSYVLDLGCGTGSLTSKIHEKCQESHILATDIAPGMLQQVEDLGLSNVKTQLEDGAALAGLEANSFTHGVSSFAINFLPDPTKAIESLVRVVKPGGVVGTAVWGVKVDWGNAIETAAKRLDPDYKYVVPESPLALRSESDHATALRSVGLRDVQTETVEMPLAASSPKGVVEYAFRGRNPVMNKMIVDWQVHGGRVEALEREYEKVIVEQFPNGVFADAVLAWGVK